MLQKLQSYRNNITMMHNSNNLVLLVNVLLMGALTV